MINVFGSSAGQAEIDELTQSIATGWMGMGRKVSEFETAFGEKIAAPFAMVDSGSDALYLAVKLLDLPPGSEIIVPSFTWVACAHAVLLAGHRVVFADVDPETQNVTAKALEIARTSHTKAVMVVHYAGKPVHMDSILSLGLPVIEDAAHAVDSAIAGRACGTIGTIGIFSFDSVKNLATPEAGGLTCRDPALLQRAKNLRYCGIGKSGFDTSSSRERWWEYDIHDVFPKMLPNDVSASIALAQLRNLDRNQARRRMIWAEYHRELAELSWLRTPLGPAADERHSYFTYLVRILDGRRDALAKFLLRHDIYTTLRYHPLHLNPIYQSSASLPGCELLNEQGLNLPLHPGLSDDDVAIVIDAVKRF